MNKEFDTIVQHVLKSCVSAIKNGVGFCLWFFVVVLVYEVVLSNDIGLLSGS